MSKRDEMEWVDFAVCGEAGAAPMFPGADDAYGIAAAKNNCHQCPVVVECLDQALANNEKFGVWGGLTTTERDDFRRLTTRRKNRLAELEKAKTVVLDAAAGL